MNDRKSEIVETGILGFVFSCGFWVAAEFIDFVFGMLSGFIDLM